MSGNLLQVLIIEDDLIYQSILEKQIKSAINCQITKCSSITSAIDKLQNQYGLVILDHNLPDGNSVDILNLIKEESIEIPVIIMSQQEEIEVAVQLMEKGAHTYIEKSPAGLRKLSKAINELKPYFELQNDIQEDSKATVFEKKTYIIILLIIIVAFIVLVKILN